MPLPKLYDDLDQAVGELGEAMQHPAFVRILECLEAFEYHVVVHGIDDPGMSKDFIQGAVHASRSMRETLSTAKRQFDESMRKGAAETRVARDFFPPGSGSGGLS